MISIIQGLLRSCVFIFERKSCYFHLIIDDKCYILLLVFTIRQKLLAPIHLAKLLYCDKYKSKVNFWNGLILSYHLCFRHIIIKYYYILVFFSSWAFVWLRNYCTGFYLSKIIVNLLRTNYSVLFHLWRIVLIFQFPNFVNVARGLLNIVVWVTNFIIRRYLLVKLFSTPAIGWVRVRNSILDQYSCSVNLGHYLTFSEPSFGRR